MNGNHVSFGGFKSIKGGWYESSPDDLQRAIKALMPMLMGSGVRYAVRNAVL